MDLITRYDRPVQVNALHDYANSNYTYGHASKNEHLIGCKHDMFYHQAFQGLRVLDKCSHAK